LILQFLLTQLIGIYVTNAYSSSSKDTLPSFIEPPKDVAPQVNLISIIIAIVIGIFLIFILMRFKAEFFLRTWFFVVVAIAIAITLNAFFSNWISFIISLVIAIPLAFIKVFVRNIKVHNLTELAIYPGIASLFIPLLSINTVVILLIVISLYDMYAVWHSGFMQKMAKYQIQQLKFFSGFFIPYLGKKEKEKLNKSKSKKTEVKVNVAILGGGDVVFPIILAGVVLAKFGLFSAILVSLGATFALGGLFYMSEKGKFYPAMPFISIGCLISLLLVYCINYF
jgi:presenilin-like A22 family membrane protease